MVEVTVADTRLRLARSSDGILISRLLLTPAGEPLQLRRWRFALTETTAAANKLLDEALAAGEMEARSLRAVAEQTTRRAIAAADRMRPNAGARRMLEVEAARAMNTYLNRSQEVAWCCADAQAQLATAGFPTGERGLPVWIAEVQRLMADTDCSAPTTL